MQKTNNQSLIKYVLAFLIPLIFLLSLKWNADSAMNLFENMDMYFDSDVARVISNLEDNGKISHDRSRTHPYFSIFAVTVSKAGVYLGIQNVAFPIYKLVFGTLGAFLFWLFVYKNTNTMQAFASLTLLLCTMSFRVWAAVPETFLFSFFTLMLALNLMQLKAKPEYVLLSTLAGTTTNLFLGLVHLLLEYKNKTVILKILLSFILLAIMLAIIQQAIYPTAAHFFDIYAQKKELKHFVESLSSTQFRVFDFFISGFIVPLSSEIKLPVTTASLWQEFFSVTFLSSKRMMLLTMLTMSTLVLTYLMALYAFIKSNHKSTISKSILIFIGFELILHLVYGADPFLYSLNFTPLIIIFMSLHQPEKLKPFVPFLMVFLALLVQRFNFIDPNLFAKYFF